jgi:hypothetical protein
VFAIEGDPSSKRSDVFAMEADFVSKPSDMFSKKDGVFAKGFGQF